VRTRAIGQIYSTVRSAFIIEALETRRLLAGLTIDPIATAAIDEGDAASFNININDVVPLQFHRYQIDYGDGGASYTSPIFDSTVTQFPTPPRTYVDDPTMAGDAWTGTVTVYRVLPNGTVLDQASREFSQVVRNVAPTLWAPPLPPQAIVEGGQLAFEYVQVDPGVADVISVTVDWGDGDVTVDQAIRVSNPAGGYDVLPVKPTPYRHAGTYTLTVTSRDDDGGQLIEQAPVNVNRAFTLNGAATVPADTSYSLQLRTTNPDSDQVSWLIDWGDGGAAQQYNLTMSASAPATVTHVYAGPVSREALISATATEANQTYATLHKQIDVPGTIPAAPAPLALQVTANTRTDLPYQGLRQVKLFWRTIVPSRVQSFDLERSANGTSGWQTIATNLTPGANAQTNYTDLNGTQTYF
jgi:hypothetical protein